MGELESTNINEEESSLDIWGDDKLGRKVDADFLIRFLTRRIEERDEHEKSYVLNIDASWGGGKSFFLERFGKQLEAENHLVTHVNAWEDDHIEDPQIAVMAAIEAKIDDLLGRDDPLRKDWKGVKKYALPIAGALAAATETLIGSPFDKGRDTFERMMQNSITAIDVVVQEKKAVADFKKAFSNFLGKLNGSRKLPFFILVDEMDRCRPPYAIALLERVKHLFDIDNVVFVFATDTEQLSHSIGAVYGVNFASRKYLQRFFNQTYLFKEPELESFVEHLVQKHQLGEAKIIWEPQQRPSLSYYLSQCFHSFSLNLRSVEQCVETLSNIVTAWEYNELSIKGIVLLPMIIAHHEQRKIENTAGELRAQYSEDWHQLSNWKVNNFSEPKSWLDVLAVYEKVLVASHKEDGLFELENKYHPASRSAIAVSSKQMHLWVINQVKAECDYSFRQSPERHQLVLESYLEIVRSVGRLAQFS